MNSRFEWVRPPETLAKNIELYGKKVMAAIVAIAQYSGQKMQNEARRNAPWEDRTANARSGIFYAVQTREFGVVVGEIAPGALEQKTDVKVVGAEDGTVQLFLGHTVFYGKYLETSNGGRYAVIMTTIQNNLPDLKRALDRLLK